MLVAIQKAAEGFTPILGQRDSLEGQRRKREIFPTSTFISFLSFLITLNFLCPEELVILLLSLMVFGLFNFNFRRLPVFFCELTVRNRSRQIYLTALAKFKSYYKPLR